MKLDRAILGRLWPHAPGELLDAVTSRSTAVFAKHAINTPLRVAHFMAQVSHESGGGTITRESLNYTTPARIAAVWPSRFTVDSAAAYVRNPRKLASKVYNGRMGNRAGTDDGYTYAGGGLLQLTGRDSYDQIGRLCGLDLLNHPELAYAPDTALEIAATEFARLACLPFCDKDDIRGVTRRVNGGYIGVDSRAAWLAKWKLALPELPGTLPQAPEDVNDVDKQQPRGADPDVPPAPTPAQSKTLWSTLGQILASAGASVAAFISADWKVILVLAVVVIAFALFIGRERLLKIIDQGV